MFHWPGPFTHFRLLDKATNNLFLAELGHITVNILYFGLEKEISTLKCSKRDNLVLYRE